MSIERLTLENPTTILYKAVNGITTNYNTHNLQYSTGIMRNPNQR